MGFTLKQRGQQLQEFPGFLQLDAIQSPPLAGSVNDLELPDGENITCWILNANEDFVLTGLAGGRSQTLRILVNASEFNCVIDEQVSSAAENQFQTSGGIAPGQVAIALWNATLEKWLLFGGAQSSASFIVNTLTVNVLLAITGQLRLGSPIEVAVAAGTNNNLLVAGPTPRILLNAAGVANITGFTFLDINADPYTPQMGDEWRVTNISDDEITFTNDSGASTIPILCPGGVDRVLLPGETLIMWYDGSIAASLRV